MRRLELRSFSLIDCGNKITYRKMHTQLPTTAGTSSKSPLIFSSAKVSMLLCSPFCDKQSITGQSITGRQSVGTHDSAVRSKFSFKVSRQSGTNFRLRLYVPFVAIAAYDEHPNLICLHTEERSNSTFSVATYLIDSNSACTLAIQSQSRAEPSRIQPVY